MTKHEIAARLRWYDSKPDFVGDVLDLIKWERTTARLASARALLTELAENGLTPYGEKIRAWLADED